MDVGILIARVAFGVLLAAHGCQKLFGWFGGPGLSGTAAFFESLGFRPSWAFVVMVGLAEIGGGLLLANGLPQPAGSAPIISVMFVAIATVHWGNGLLAPKGIEHPFLYLAAAVALAVTGPGELSLDARIGLTSWWTPQVTALVLAAGLAGGVASLEMRRRAPGRDHAQASGHVVGGTR